MQTKRKTRIPIRFDSTVPHAFRVQTYGFFLSLENDFARLIFFCSLVLYFRKSSFMPEVVKSGKIVLIVEDDDNNMLFYRELFKRTKYPMLYAKNGVQAVQAVKDNDEIGLVLMDIKMPFMGGFEALLEIRKIKDLPVIAHTAYALSGDKEKAMAYGFTDYVTKPVNKEALLKKIDALIC